MAGEAYAKAYREVDKAQAKRVKLVGVLSRRVRRLFVAVLSFQEDMA